MDIEKLIEKANHLGMELKRDGGEFEYSIGKKFLEYATALSTLQTENERLRGEIEDVRLEGYAKGLGEMSEENEKLRAELEYEKEHANAYYEECGQWEAENTQLKEKVEAFRRERDTIEQDFRAFTKQWWEETNGFPCRFCKFEHSGGCEQRAKHPDDEKPCVGRWFEWRGQKED